MRIWIAKAFIQKFISFFPFKHRVNYLFQKYVTKGVILTDDLMDDKLSHCKNHLSCFSKYSKKTNGLVTLEIGTGWYPIVPIGFYLSGADEIYTIDLTSLLKTSAIHETVEKFQEYDRSGKLASFIPGLKSERLEKLNSLLKLNSAPEKILETINIKSITGDARKIAMPDAKFDLINSNNTFEHIYPEILQDILIEFNRVLKPGGIMSHQIDMSDHFAHLDKSITIYNFLKYTDAEWNLIDNSVQPQNRLRLSDYQKLFTKAGFQILEEISRPGSIEDLKGIKLAQKYRSYTESGLATSHSLIIASKKQ